MPGTLIPKPLKTMLVALAISLPFQGSGWAQTAPNLPPEKAKQFLELMNDPEVKAWLEGSVAPPAAEPGAGSTADIVSDWQAAVHDRIGGLIAAIPHIPEELSKAADVVWRDVNSGRPAMVLVIVVVLLAVGFSAEWLIRRAMGQVNATQPSETPQQAAPVMTVEIAALLTFALASVGSFVAFDWPPLLRKIVLLLLAAIVAFRFVRAFANFALSVLSSAGAAVKDSAAVRFWHRRISVMSGILLFGWALTGAMNALGMSIEMIRLVAYLLGLGLLAAAIGAVWHRSDRKASTVRRMLVSMFLLLLWVIWVAGMPGLLWVGIYVLLLPAAVQSAGRLARAVVGPARPSGAVGVAVDVLVVRGARAVVIAAAVAWLAYLWRSEAGILSSGELGGRLVGGALNAIIVVLIADLVWNLSKGMINQQLDAASQTHGSAEDIARSGRLKTLLPILRNTLAVFIGVMTVLTILSGLGVEIGPLIAGAGIFGVAIGFGSQTLVKDVLSGVFYMLDDAFRVGEYIQSGSYKGTVEGFSLRSVRLRHHRGPVYTVPFGQLGAVQNMSRDWAIEKMIIGVTYDADIDLARKLVKKIGLELAADPEFAADTLEPLKMQGIENFGDYAIELKMKLMTKPGTAFAIKRRALMMIKKAFDENGIKIAVPTVHVEGGNADAAAAARQQIVRANQAAELATNQA